MKKQLNAHLIAAGLTAAALALVPGVVVAAEGTESAPAPAESTEPRETATATETSPAYGTCSAEAHEKYQVTGADGEKYDGWHPTTVTDPQTGKKCTFGHDHGDDPKTSAIYDWTMKKLGGETDGIPMAYAGMQSMKDGANVVPHRHEDHYGYTFYVANDVAQVRSDRKGYAKSGDSKTSCDYLIGLHQGSHSNDALHNNAHEILYAAKCNDGVEMVVDSLSLFGQPNEYEESCTGRTVKTSGSELPESAHGKRSIPTVACAKKTQQVYDADARQAKTSDSWGLYERWEADQTYTMPNGNTVSIDPWFGVRNPSRIADGNEKVATASLFGADTVGWPWSTMTKPLEQTDAASPFNGARRDLYLQNSRLDNRGGQTVWYTDAYGKNPSSKPFKGSVKQYASATSNADGPELERRVFGFSTNYGPAGSGVSAPN
ncbi:hypothetical protein [Brevibacterium moorei]|uniref:hypothetical protein n=1 Tax=Brevibacterium moorei TaxID=2968457 RepID=UPI00211C76D0|nr:hypothetical protein [Brevibacterium sp. 68QC2CO]MCQ9386603.1 hypothetical protein [Brevibacterium sp. 68QC2CO]